MRHTKYWIFQAPQEGAKVAQQDIKELTDLASGLIAFERLYLSTHGERTPVFRLLSMINEAISQNCTIIEHELIYGKERKSDKFFPTKDDDATQENG